MNVSCDVQFGYAVHRAARGLRPMSKVDVATTGAALAAILRSAADLDRYGLELLALAVTGKLRKREPLPSENAFAQAVRRASAAWRPGKDLTPENAGDELANMLRSGQPSLGTGEREFLAELVVGDLRRGETKPKLGPGCPQYAEIMSMLDESEKEIAKNKAKPDAQRRAELDPLKEDIRTLSAKIKIQEGDIDMLEKMRKRSEPMETQLTKMIANLKKKKRELSIEQTSSAVVRTAKVLNISETVVRDAAKLTREQDAVVEETLKKYT